MVPLFSYRRSDEPLARGLALCISPSPSNPAREVAPHTDLDYNNPRLRQKASDGRVEELEAELAAGRTEREDAAKELKRAEKKAEELEAQLRVMEEAAAEAEARAAQAPPPPPSPSTRPRESVSEGVFLACVPCF